MNKCEECGGSGVIDVEGAPSRECHCAFVRRVAGSMPPYIRKTEIRNEHLGLPLLRQTKRHFLVVSAWQDMKAVIKAIMITQTNFFLKITSDREIRDVYVGSKSKANRGDLEGSFYNSLEDLMDPPDLMVVRLNELSYKNKAAPGALEEAISFRLDRDKPTWLFSDIDKPFTVGSHAYSDSVADMIKSSFSPIRVPRILPSLAPGDDIYEGINPIEIAQVEERRSLPEVNSGANRSLAPIPVSVSQDPEPVKTKSKPLPEPVEDVKPKKKLMIRPSEDIDAPDVGLGRYGSGISTSKSFSKDKKR